jgi:hypothetical protein
MERLELIGVVAERRASSGYRFGGFATEWNLKTVANGELVQAEFA